MKQIDKIRNITAYYKTLDKISKTYRERGCWRRSLKKNNLKIYNIKYPRYFLTN